MSKIFKNSSSQSSNVIYIKNIFINPMLNYNKKLTNDLPQIYDKNKPSTRSIKHNNYERCYKRKEDIDSELSALKKKLTKTLYSKVNRKMTRNIKEINKSCLNLSQRNLVAVGYRFKPQITNISRNFVIYKNKSYSNARLKM